MIFFFFFNYTATTEIYTLSLHDALPISLPIDRRGSGLRARRTPRSSGRRSNAPDRKSTRLNSSHLGISYAVFCLKKKNTTDKKKKQTLESIINLYDTCKVEHKQKHQCDA